ncbi:hypothetical protein EYF80_051603 [Liparis tanakae]|uniref:Uncharacterized protein n=1 Tax=Liparis tanakae TaxID=230148 RepID=A0A4Z2FAF8_9TELE|nr:hypothetical protein EYF80_051603 [Liparis tanakae]
MYYGGSCGRAAFRYYVLTVTYQVAVAVLGAQHGRHLPEVGGVARLLHAGGERHGDDPLRDVDQLQWRNGAVAPTRVHFYTPRYICDSLGGGGERGRHQIPFVSN